MIALLLGGKGPAAARGGRCRRRRLLALAVPLAALQLARGVGAVGEPESERGAEDEGGDSLLEEEVTAAEDETTVDATPHLKKLFAQKEG